MIKKLLLIAAFIVLIFSLFSCQSKEKYSETFFTMDTVIEITSYGEKPKNFYDSCLTLLQEVTEKITYNGGYTIATQNDNTKIELSEELASMILKSFEISEISDGLYDVTISPLVSLWDIKNAKAPPSKEKIEEKKQLVNYKEVSIDENILTFNLSGAAIDIGSIGKGFAGDYIAKKLQENGITSGIVNLGGNITVFGKNPNNSDGVFTIGIKNPFSVYEIIATVQVNDTNVITSGDYERFFYYENKRYHHIIDPKTGYPAESGASSATVICKDGVLADALSTALFLCGAEKFTEIMQKVSENFTDIAAVVILESGEFLTFNAETYNFSME